MPIIYGFVIANIAAPPARNLSNVMDLRRDR
jgi:hypothetical protein